MPTSDRRRIKGTVYQRTSVLLFEAGHMGATVAELATDELFIFHAQPESAVRRAINELLAEGKVEALDPDEVPVRVRWIAEKPPWA